MALYIAIFIFSILLSLIKDKKIQKNGCNILLLIMTLMCIFRGKDVGSDTVNYITIYNSVYGLMNFLNEPLFSLIGFAVHKCSGNYYAFQIILGLITYLPLFIIFNKYSKNVSISVLIFIFATNRYFFETFNIVRQAAATSYLLWCWIMIYKKSYWKALILFLVAVGFHHTSWIYLPIALFALKFKLKTEVVYISILCTLVFSIVFADMSFLVSLQKLVLSEEAIGKYDHYESELARSIWGLLPVVLPAALITIMGYNKNKDNFLFRLYSYGSIFAIFISVLPMAYRISYGVMVLELLIIPMMFKERSKNIRAMMLYVVVCIILFSISDFYSTCKMAKLVPYSIF